MSDKIREEFEKLKKKYDWLNLESDYDMKIFDAGHKSRDPEVLALTSRVAVAEGSNEELKEEVQRLQIYIDTTCVVLVDLKAENKKLREQGTRIIEFDDEVRDILGRPNFTCMNIANRLREKGHEIKHKAEDEQASVLYWMLSMYVKHGKQWKQEGETYLKQALKKDGE